MGGAYGMPGVLCTCRVGVTPRTLREAQRGSKTMPEFHSC